MPSVRTPIPMLSPLGWGSSTGSGLPDNTNVLAALESFHRDIQAIASYKAASLFCRSKEISLSTHSDRRLRSYPEILERILNWSFIIADKSIFDWRADDIQKYLEFLVEPNVSWIGSAPCSRFVRESNTAYENWQFNERWRPFRRIIKNGVPAPPSIRMYDKERKLVLELFEFIASKLSHPLSYLSLGSIKELDESIPKRYMSRSAQRACRSALPVLRPHELDWIFGRVAELQETDWYYHIVLFAMAIARYSEIPIKSLCHEHGRDGLLSQFEFGIDEVWKFKDWHGLEPGKTHIISKEMEFYLKIHTLYLGVPFADKLPDIGVLARPNSIQGFGYDYIGSLMERFRVKIIESIETCNDPIILSRKEILSRVSFALIRRSRLRPAREPKKRGRQHKQ